jgi:manganese/zinc/iron transport system ATP- binding protein
MIPYRQHVRTTPHRAADVAAIDAAHVFARYPGAPETALCDVSLRVQAGSRVALVGSNGAGKSTLLKAAAGLLSVESGELTVFGHAIGEVPQRVAYLAQRGEIDWRFPISLRKLVMGGRYVHLGWLRWPGKQDWALVDAAIARMGLSDLRERQIGELSGGQQQRALLARALAQDADLLLLDEPLNAVDATTRQIVSSTLHDLKRQGKTAVVATHDIDRVHADFDDALYLVDGRVIGHDDWHAQTSHMHDHNHDHAQAQAQAQAHVQPAAHGVM